MGKAMIYLDNASTTKPSKKAIEAANSAFSDFGNPSSLHRLGMVAEKIIKEARLTVSEKLSVDEKNIFFTSGGTESNNTAILGYALKNQKNGRHLVTTKIEHPSVLEPFKYLEKQGFSVTYLGVSKDGVISLDEFENALTEDTIMVSVMAVNNETGVIQPIDKLKAIMQKKSPKAVLHSDCVQAFCKIPLHPKKWGVDMLSVSGHKIHALKGTGALYIAENVHLDPIILGGGQEKGIRSGTENTAGIAAFSAAIKDIKPISTDKRSELIAKITAKIPDVKVNGTAENSGYVLNVSFLGIKAEILLHSLEAKGIYVSTGSACSSNKPQPSHVLTAMGVGRENIEGAIRFSFCDDDFDSDYVVSVLAEEARKIRKYVR
ncbi:MAG: cysteine desulfurase [Clostridia bacterium]|nr:cysteine desulfurase [Clostridia bacterium]